jgi:hypothetical protein
LAIDVHDDERSKSGVDIGATAPKHASESQHEKSESPITVFPEAGPRDGCEAIVSCRRLDGLIHEVLVDGIKGDIIEATSERARIRVPPSQTIGSASVELRTKAWLKHVAFSQAGFRYYDPIGFGVCGRNVNLEAADGALAKAPPRFAKREEGLLEGVALTARPLTAVDKKAVLAGQESGPNCRSYYFETCIQAVSGKSRGTTRTFSIGFAWPRLAAVSECEVASDASTEIQFRLPEMATQLKCGFVVGGDLPRAFMGGKCVKNVSGWRPLLEVVSGVSIGALLEIEELTQQTPAPKVIAGSGSGSKFRLKVFQQGTLRCTIETPAPTEWLRIPPYGVVDVCGNVLGVELRQGAEPPLSPPQTGIAPSGVPRGVSIDAALATI